MNAKTSLKAPVITIDGPCGVGKGTIAHVLSRKLHWHVLDSGAIYRAVAFAANHHNILLTDEKALTDLIGQINLTFKMNMPGHFRVILDGFDITEDIRQPNMGALASKISVFPQVRTALFSYQRDLAQPPGLVADGRDMGTVVFPDATVKIFLEATAEERAKRRHNQLIKQGVNVTLAQVFDELLERDERDMNRDVAPLRKPEDAIVVDSTLLGIQEVIDQILAVLPKELIPAHV